MFALLLSVQLAAGPALTAVGSPSDPETVAGQLAVSTTPGRHPALIVSHERWDLDADARTEAFLAAQLKGK